jgi:hypothetical protein
MTLLSAATAPGRLCSASCAMHAFVVHGALAALDAAAAVADENEASALDRAAAALEKDADASGLGVGPVLVLADELAQPAAARIAAAAKAVAMGLAVMGESFRVVDGAVKTRRGDEGFASLQER